MRLGRRRLAILLTLPALALGAAGCGGDDEDTTTSVPSISVPSTEQQSVPTTTTPSTTEPPTTTEKKGGSTGGTGSYDPGKPDSPENDVPPPPGSPQEAFEKQCEQNPSACG